MNSSKLTSCLLFFCLVFSGYGGVKGSVSIPSFRQHRQNEDNLFGFKPTALFVFGDSYVDAGNLPRDTWRFPYGITWPGYPTGRASDGFVSSDILAHSFGLESPVPYEQRNSSQDPKYGMNFAYGGAGVFETEAKTPNATLQIDNFERVLGEGVYSQADLSSSAALFSIGGNDYGTFSVRVGTQEELMGFIIRVVRQMAVDLKRIQSLGLRKVVVAALPPLGCLPSNTAAGGFNRCNETIETALKFHNFLLEQTLTQLNDMAEDEAFVMLDIYHAFRTVLENKGVPEFSYFPDPLRPCCMGIKQNFSCGSVNGDGKNMFTFCSDPFSSFWWDQLHPSHQGWLSVYFLLLHGLTPLKTSRVDKLH